MSISSVKKSLPPLSMAKKSVRAIFLKNNRAMITIVKASESWMPMSQNGDHQKRHEYTYAYIDR